MPKERRYTTAQMIDSAFGPAWATMLTVVLIVLNLVTDWDSSAVALVTVSVGVPAVLISSRLLPTADDDEEETQ